MIPTHPIVMITFRRHKEPIVQVNSLDVKTGTTRVLGLATSQTPGNASKFIRAVLQCSGVVPRDGPVSWPDQYCAILQFCVISCNIVQYRAVGCSRKQCLAMVRLADQTNIAHPGGFPVSHTNHPTPIWPPLHPLPPHHRSSTCDYVIIRKTLGKGWLWLGCLPSSSPLVRLTMNSCVWHFLHFDPLQQGRQMRMFRVAKAILEEIANWKLK